MAPQSTEKRCNHSELRRAKTGGWFCVDGDCDFSIPEPASPSSNQQDVPYHQSVPYALDIAKSCAEDQTHRHVWAKVAKILAAEVRRLQDETSGEWRCFHCDEVFTDREKAAEHFGKYEMLDPACTIDVAEYRRMEEVNRQHCSEDTELHRAIHRMSADHQVALRREEETGYARGLRDAGFSEKTSVPISSTKENDDASV